ncbi:MULTISPECIES: Tfp pilus assembly protein FimT/FimU [unclassified Salinivibrio]|uniref:pilus assembly FimT family protein n=1 Tax=unclassified Salinivibrio TaxID=2636825 RepID=UPI00128E4889|nr:MULTISPECIES: type II secretion system protein [unclassified Salinivibrio]MPX92105.1 type II secretion system protein [Salinivibrio sp. VYel1]MPY01310.1 type II secretion system protein [Salinivibrio sp. VYel4]
MRFQTLRLSQCSRRCLKKMSGITLIESLLVLSVLAAVCTIAIPRFSSAQQATMIASRSESLTSLFHLAQARAMEESRVYHLRLLKAKNTQCIVAQPSRGSGLLSSAPDQLSAMSCQQTRLPMVTIPTDISLLLKAKKSWAPLPEGEIFSIDFRTQRPTLNLTVGLGSGYGQAPDYVVTVRQYLGFESCQWGGIDSACS